MKKSNRTVLGSFMDRDEAVREIQRLHNLGYTRSEINVYSNPERARTVERLMEIEVEGTIPPNEEAIEDTSWWDTIKDSFSFHAFHSEDGHRAIRRIEGEKKEGTRPVNEGESSQTLELLEPYNQDLADGKLVIVVDNYGTR